MDNKKQVYTKLLKKGMYGFYVGGKKATAEEIKGFIKKSGYETLKSEHLPADLRRYAGAVKGGKNRANNTLVNKQGQFLPKALQDKALKRLGINIEEMRKAKNVKAIRDIFSGNEALQRSFDKLINDTGVEFWYDENKVLDKIDTYNGDKIFYNGKETDTNNTVKKVSSFIKKMHRKYELYYPGIAFRLIYKGTDRLYITIEEDFILSTGEDTDNVQLFHADKEATKKGKPKTSKKKRK